MPTPQELYQAKRVPPEAALAGLPRRVSVVLPFFAAQPPGLIGALAAAVREGAFDALTLHYMHLTEHTATALLRLELCDVVKPRSFFFGPADRALFREGLAAGRRTVEFVPTSFSDIPRLIRDCVAVDLLPLQVSAMDRAGYFSLGLSGAYTQAALAKAKRVVVETNPNMPRTFGPALIHVSEVDAIVEGASAMPVSEPRPPDATDQAIADRIVRLIPDRACLQFGVGGVPNSVAARLTDRRDLGVHTELIADGLAELIAAGAVSNRYKRTDPGKTVFTIAMGSARTYALMHDNPTMECHPADYVNDPRVIGANDNVVAVNAMIEIDLLGQVNAEFLGDFQFSAPGGQLDFVRGAAFSRGGISVITARATAAEGKASRIVPRLMGPATDTRVDAHCVATEFGLCNLRGLSARERARALIGLAHPDFRAGLEAAAHRMHLL
jgi:itaconate CoA-transferase